MAANTTTKQTRNRPSPRTQPLVPDVDRALEKGNVGLARRLIHKHLATGAKVADESHMQRMLLRLGPDAFPFYVGAGALCLYATAWVYALAWQKF